MAVEYTSTDQPALSLVFFVVGWRSNLQVFKLLMRTAGDAKVEIGRDPPSEKAKTTRGFDVNWHLQHDLVLPNHESTAACMNLRGVILELRLALCYTASRERPY